MSNEKCELEKFALEIEELPKLYLQINGIKKSTNLLLEYTILVLWWFSSTLNSNNTKILQSSQHCARLIQLCYDFRVFDFGCTVGKLFERNDIASSDLHRKSSSWQILLTYAKCLRREGKYGNAYSQYFRIAEKISENNDISAHAQLLLNMGKAAHNHEWRTGYSQCLVLFATKRFRKLLDKEPVGTAKYREFSRFLAICLDSQAMINYEVNHHRHDNQLEIKFPNKLQKTWKKALEYAEQANNHNSELRIRCRSSFVEFNLATGEQKKILALHKFYTALKQLEAIEENDRRGLAVRFRQYAEMLVQIDPLEHEDNIKFYLKKSISYAETEKDWRTLITNKIAFATIFCKAKYWVAEETIDLLKNALRVLQLKLHDRLPELEVEANLELARQLRVNGDYIESEERLKNAHDIVMKLEERLHSDLEPVLTSKKAGKHSLVDKKTTYAPICLLTRSEMQKVREALFSDFQLHSVLLNKVAKERLLTAQFAASQTTIELQLSFHQECIQGHAHSFKGIIENFRVRIQREQLTQNSLRDVLEETAEQVEKQFNELLIYKTSLTPSFVSVERLVIKLIKKINDSTMFDGVIIKPYIMDSGKNSSDFFVFCCSKIFEIVIDNLIVNSARAAIQSSSHSKEVNVRVFVEKSTVNKPSYGIIEILDTGGEVQKLERAMKIATDGLPQNSGNAGSFGLPHALQFLQGFNGQLEVDGNQQFTILRVKIPNGERVQL